MSRWTPCDELDENGMSHCPFADTYGGYEDEMCRVCCGLGVDEDEPEDYYGYDEEEEYRYES